MDVWLNYAYICDGIVQNIACFLYNGYLSASVIAKDFCHNRDAFAVDVTHIPVTFGDSYEDGKFYRMINGVKTEITPLPTIQQEVRANSNAIDDILVMLLEGGDLNV